jgi:2'-5' RNA ligase
MGGRADDTMTIGLPISGGSTDQTVTIGVAVDVPAPWAGQLQRWRATFGDPLAGAIPAHVTLLPPTAVPGGDMVAILDHLYGVAARSTPFTLRLRGTGTFRPVSPVVFVQVEQGVDGCDALQQRVRTGPLERPLTFPYHPHVTVAHHLADEALDRAEETLRDFAASFAVDGFGFYEHGSDGVWRHRHRFAFAGAGA